MNRFVILGSSNAVAKLGQDNTHLFVESGDKKILVDCGDNPMAKLSSIGVSITEVTDLILTHFHADHVGSLPLLIMDMWLEKRQEPLAIHGLDFTLERAKKLLELFSWEKWMNMFPVSFNSIPEQGMNDFIKNEGISVSTLPVLHLIPTLGFRFEFEGERVITYSCDTEPCENLHKLASGADVLLQESAGESKGHTSARQAGEIATAAGVKRLILLHFDNRIEEDALVADAKKSYKGDVIVAHDLMLV